MIEIRQGSQLRQLKPNSLFSITKLTNEYKPTYLPTLSYSLVDFEELKFYNLFQLRNKQFFRVAYGKSKWFFYEKFMNGSFNLREVLDDEVIIEFDDTNWKGSLFGFQEVISSNAIMLTAVNLYKAGITFEVWDHKGKSPHIHIRNLPIKHLSKEDRKLWKETFVKHYCPKEYLDYVDLSLCGVHLVALEWCEHWKGKYGIKRLLHKFNPLEDNSPGVKVCAVPPGD